MTEAKCFPERGLGAKGDGAWRYWERRRLAYNLVLGVVAVTVLLGTWPEFRAALNPKWIPESVVFLALANLGYCAAYAAELALRWSARQVARRRIRGVLWLFGTFVAGVLEYSWFVNGIRPSLSETSHFPWHQNE